MKIIQAASLVVLSLTALFAQAEKDSSTSGDPLFKGMHYRSIGPYRGGRSLTVAGIPGDPTTYYFGATGGG